MKPGIRHVRNIEQRRVCWSPQAGECKKSCTKETKKAETETEDREGLCRPLECGLRTERLAVYSVALRAELLGIHATYYILHVQRYAPIKITGKKSIILS